jgi:hypothetical protein
MMRHQLAVSRHPDGGFEVRDPHTPWLRPSRGRTPEEAVNEFEKRLRFVSVEKRQRRNWLIGTGSWFYLIGQLALEIARAAGLEFLRRPMRYGIALLVVLPTILCLMVWVGIV